MNKETVLFSIVGLMIGLIIGFLYANSADRQLALGPTSLQNFSLPPGHPDSQNADPASQQPAAAVPEVQTALEQARNEPNNFDAQVKAAEMYYRIKKYDESAKFFTRANQLKPDDYSVIVKLGNVNFDAENYIEAEKWYSTALSVKPEDTNVRTDFGLTFMFRQPPDYDRAIQEFTTLLESDPSHSRGLQNLAVAYLKKDEVDKATAIVSRLEKADPKNPAILNLRSDIKAIQSK